MKEVKFCLASGFGSAELVDDDADAAILALDAGRRALQVDCTRLEFRALCPPAAVC